MLLRGFWKRWTFLLCFCLIVVALFFKIINHKQSVSKLSNVKSKFSWLYVNNNTDVKKCQNSKQGAKLIADEKGYICHIEEVMRNGCCNPSGNFSEQYSCLDCQTNHCCKVYEHCISCCLQPRKRKILDLVLQHAETVQDPILSSIQNLFELCLHKCRTSSSSIRQENIYRDSVYKFCYGVEVPDLVKPHDYNG